MKAYCLWNFNFQTSTLYLTLDLTFHFTQKIVYSMFTKARFLLDIDVPSSLTQLLGSVAAATDGEVGEVLRCCAPKFSIQTGR